MIKFEDIKQSYTGRIGCMCGCIGNYYIASSFGIDRANAETGWEAYEKCNDRAVRMAVNRINKLIDWTDSESIEKHVNDHHAWFEYGERTVVVYFKKGTSDRVL